jgi:hypothetical protein
MLSVIAGVDNTRLFPMGYLKEKVFSHRLQDIEELKARILQEVCSITNDVLRGMIGSFHYRLQQCIANRGDHCMDIIFKI